MYSTKPVWWRQGMLFLKHASAGVQDVSMANLAEGITNASLRLIVHKKCFCACWIDRLR